MSGDFFKWYDWLVSLGGLEVRFVHGEDQHKAAGRFLETCSDNPTNAEIQDGKKIEVDTPEWVVLRSRSLGGLFLRIMPVGILSGIGPILKEDSDSGRIRTIPQKESEIIANQVIKANMPIRLSWSEF